jgi:hypothetical protein
MITGSDMPREFYAGIGSRSTPAEVKQVMTRCAQALGRRGFVLRSGAAQGADTAFEIGASAYPKQIFIPWSGFMGRYANEHTHVGVDEAALSLASEFHPAWHRCSPAAKKLHARNSYQVLGLDLQTPAKFILCWTEGAKGEGGTGQALRIARRRGIPIYDFGEPLLLKRWSDFADRHGEIP